MKPRNKRSKYNAIATKVDDIVFDSKKEAGRYAELKIMERAGLIRKLVLQPKYDLIPTTYIQGETHKKITYKADFGYVDAKTNKWVVEDVKGVKTDVYKIKKRLMKTVHDIEVVEI